MGKYVIVGGVAGGASAAARLRRLDEYAEIVLFERSEHISFANCGLPYYIGGKIPEQEELLLQTPESFSARFRVDVRVFNEVTGIDRGKKFVTVKDCVLGSEYQETYDKLILSPGAYPFVPDLPGADLPGVFVLRNIADSQAILQAVQASKKKRAVLVGGGFIGIELAENLVRQGMEVSLIEAAPQIMTQFDSEMAKILERKLRENGVRLYLNCPLAEIRVEGDGYVAVTGNGKDVEGDFVVLAIGVRPDTALAAGAGLEVNARGAIWTKGDLSTSDPDIYAIGDAAEITNRITKRRVVLPLAGPANKQGRLVAGNLLGARKGFPGVVGSSVLQVFDLTAACTGLNERALKQEQISYEKVYLSPGNHAGYYPDSRPIWMKLLFGLDGTLFGVQAIGGAGTEKRVDVVATAIQLHGTVNDLAALELCYAPPYSSAKDPVNMAGYVAQNVLEGLAPIWHWEQLENWDSERVLLDVRTVEEYERGHLKGAINIPVDDLRNQLDALPEEREIWVYCQAGIRGYVAQRILMQRGFSRVYNLSGGYGLLEQIGYLEGKDQA